jgi:predicted small metal-binding protein
MRAVCPRDGCEYIAYGDDEKELRKDLRYHNISIHNSDQLPDELELLEDDRSV